VKVIVYGDFNSLYCYLASQRADRLVREGKADVEWCAVEHRPRLPVIGAKPPPRSVGAQDDLAEAAQLALPGEQLPAGPPAVISNTRAAVSAYAEAVADGIQARLRLRLFEVTWAQGRNMSSAYDVRRVVAALLWPADPISLHLVSPDLPAPVLDDPDPMRIVRREGGPPLVVPLCLYRQLGREPGPPASSCPGNSVTSAGQPGPHLAGQDSRSACKVRHARVAT
jgi:DSBA-like thioredoxin domain